MLAQFRITVLFLLQWMERKRPSILICFLTMLMLSTTIHTNVTNECKLNDDSCQCFRSVMVSVEAITLSLKKGSHALIFWLVK